MLINLIDAEIAKCSRWSCWQIRIRKESFTDYPPCSIRPSSGWSPTWGPSNPWKLFRVWRSWRCCCLFLYNFVKIKNITRLKMYFVKVSVVVVVVKSDLKTLFSSLHTTSPRCRPSCSCSPCRRPRTRRRSVGSVASRRSGRGVGPEVGRCTGWPRGLRPTSRLLSSGK